MISAVISGDIISYTALNNNEKQSLDTEINAMLELLKQEYNVFGRIVKGDYLECYVPDTHRVLRVALIIKSFIKVTSINILTGKAIKDSKKKIFQNYGIRIAIGIGELERLDTEKGIIDGEAIYLSGRLISELQSYDKERANIKNTMFIKTYSEELNKEVDVIITLLDKFFLDSTAKQSEVIMYKLKGLNESEIAERFNVSQSAVNQHSTSAGWNAIEKAVNRFEELIKEKVK